ncbi:MAG: hypothetical protein JSS30_02645 [Verrucomicrobia bacterium]|nr:hypothetical protein [Verrucomicrobiota bacterium]
MKRTHFFLISSIALLLNIDFTILKSVRNTLAVSQGNGAATIPIFELFGGLPGSIFMTWGLSWLLNHFQIHKVFLITITAFLAFFLIFAIGHLIQLSFIFYVMGELWKPALAIILFWGLINQHIPKEEAKKLYGPLMLASSLGAVAAGPIVSLCTTSKQWNIALSSMMLVVAILGAIAALLYYRLWQYFSHTPVQTSSTFSLKESTSICLRNPQLRLLSWIVIADYIAYSLGEVIFLDVLHKSYPNACDYCQYLGNLSSWCGVLNVISALLITPLILQRTRWVVAALITPLCLLLTEGAFFLFLYREASALFIFSGSLQYCICRAAKYTLFDSSKELAFVQLPSPLKMKGKLVIDGICARLGRGCGSILSISLSSLCGGVIASAPFAGPIAIAIGLSWVISSYKLGQKLEERA